MGGAGCGPDFATHAGSLGGPRDSREPSDLLRSVTGSINASGCTDGTDSKVREEQALFGSGPGEPDPEPLFWDW